MHGWLYLRPSGVTSPRWTILYGSMIAAGIEYDRYREITRVSPLCRILRGYMVLSPRVTTRTTLRSNPVTGGNLPRTPGTVSPGVAVQSYGAFTRVETITNTTRIDRDEPIVFDTTPIPSAPIPRLVPNEIALLKL